MNTTSQHIKIIWNLITSTHIHWRDWCWSSNTLATWCEELTHWKTPWCYERLKAGGEGDDRGWDGWMASPAQWTWVWESSRSWRWTGRPGVLQSTGSQKVGHNWVTELRLSTHEWILGPPSTLICKLFTPLSQADAQPWKYLQSDPL